MENNDSKYNPTKEYIEVLNDNHEISFDYDGNHYHIEKFEDDVSCSLNHDIETGISIWMFKDKDNDGIVIGTAKTPEELLTIKCFDGKTILEIDDDITDGIIY